MLALLSPAKRLDYETPVAPAHSALATTPVFMARAAELINILKTHSPRQVAQLMDLSDELAALNVARNGAWRPRNTVLNSRPAVLAFNGDVYEGLQAASLSAEDLAWAQRHLALLSGLYGVLRPMDRLQPYRLEMGSKLANPAGPDVVRYWGTSIALELRKRLRGHAQRCVVNLASQEYFSAVDVHALGVPVVDCAFEEGRAGQFKVVSFFAKRARGLMARWMVTQRCETPDQLRGFCDEGYVLDQAASTARRLVFRRATV
ncbi:hypothetical protein BurJ1DRAFT_3128 [Burkholderiales bacterium JOSHI_001]|nr:hypothetical protein BurJ1DRAFT_3128 [Burkholderiales bacterium JOSHI_001]